MKFRLHILLLQVHYAVWGKMLKTYPCLKLSHDFHVFKLLLLQFTSNYRNNPATLSSLEKVQTTLHSSDLESLYIDKYNAITDIFLL